MSERKQAESPKAADVAPWPISFDDVLRAQERIRPHLTRTPLRRYPALDAWVGGGIQVFVKHENHNPTNSFKARNGFAAVTALSAADGRRGVVAATRGNHGQGLGLAGATLGVPVVICVPEGNNPEKNQAMRGFGVELLECGKDYDEAARRAGELVQERGLTLVHPSNNRDVIAGAATLTLELLEERPDLEAIVVSVGGGSQAVGALTVLRGLGREVPVYGVQAERASAIHDSFHARRPLTTASADTIADGLATRSTYAMTFGALCEGLTDLLLVSETELADAVRTLLATTHNLAEPAGAAALAGLRRLRDRLAGKRVAIVLSGSNIDQLTLRKILEGEI
jgi:threonine dehydratase